MFILAAKFQIVQTCRPNRWVVINKHRGGTRDEHSASGMQVNSVQGIHDTSIDATDKNK